MRPQLGWKRSRNKPTSLSVETDVMGCVVILLALILATMLAGPIGFVLAAILIFGWAVVTGSLRLLWNILLLPFRLLEALARGR